MTTENLKPLNLTDYLAARREELETSIASERLAGHGYMVLSEQHALAEITQLEQWNAARTPSPDVAQRIEEATHELCMNFLSQVNRPCLNSGPIKHILTKHFSDQPEGGKAVLVDACLQLEQAFCMAANLRNNLDVSPNERGLLHILSGSFLEVGKRLAAYAGIEFKPEGGEVNCPQITDRACPAPKADSQQVGANPPPKERTADGCSKPGCGYPDGKPCIGCGRVVEPERGTEDFETQREAFVEYLNVQFPPTVGHIPIRGMVQGLQFNAFHSGKRAGQIKQAREDVQLVAVEEELPGLMPESMFVIFSTLSLEEATEFMQATVRTTKRNVMERIKLHAIELEKGIQ